MIRIVSGIVKLGSVDDGIGTIIYDDDPAIFTVTKVTVL
jgi:hypothetical protein